MKEELEGLVKASIYWKEYTMEEFKAKKTTEDEAIEIIKDHIRLDKRIDTLKIAIQKIENLLLTLEELQ
jgi:hypothetical protein